MFRCALLTIFAMALAPEVLSGMPGSGVPEAAASDDLSLESSAPITLQSQDSSNFKSHRFQGTRTKFIGKLFNKAKKAAKKGIQNAITKKAHKSDLIWKFYPEEKKWKDKVDEMKVKVAKRKAYNKAKVEQWRIQDLNPPAPFDPHTWGDKVSCVGCYMVLERAWSEAKPDVASEGETSLIEVKGVQEVAAEDIYQAMSDVCSEQISMFDYSCKTLEENSRAVTEALILNHGNTKQICETLRLCWDNLLTTYTTDQVAHPPSVRPRL